MYSLCSVTALKMFPLPLLSSVSSAEAGLKSVFMERHRCCGLVLVGSLVTEKTERSWNSSQGICKATCRTCCLLGIAEML